jgi:hypothetical protein
MRIEAGYDISFQCPQETAMVLMLDPLAVNQARAISSSVSRLR